MSPAFTSSVLRAETTYLSFEIGGPAQGWKLARYMTSNLLEIRPAGPPPSEC
jgi:hypothetical protein